MNVPGKWFSSVKSSAAIVATIMLIIGSLITLSTAALAVTQRSANALEAIDMQNLIFVWASGTASIQQKASHICQADNISASSCAEISADVRSAWLDLMQVDPASLSTMDFLSFSLPATRHLAISPTATGQPHFLKDVQNPHWLQ